VDGQTVAEHLDSKPTLLDPGQHVVRFYHDAAIVETSVLVREGERDRLVTASFAAPRPEVQPETAKYRIPPTTWAVGGAGLTAIVVGASLWIVGLTERSSLESPSGCATMQSCTASQVDTSRDKLIAGDVAVGAGLVAVAAAVWLGVAASKHTRSPQIGVVPTAGGWRVSIGGRY
jgi:hypothetical protein